MITDANKNYKKYHLKFECELCDYVCYVKGNYEKHLLTSKHLNAKTGLTKANKNYKCDICNALFMHQSSSIRHKKVCCKKLNNQPILNDTNTVIDTELIMILVKQNAELMEMLKNSSPQINNTNTNINSLYNNNNKTFNLHFFLNETCKDAMNIMDFVESIKLQLSDLEKVGELGYVEGISNIITTKLKALDVSQRPVHCTDKKREVMYIKDEDKWSKEDDSKTKLRDVIKTISNNNIRLLPLFRAKNPEYSNSSSRVSDKYEKIVIAAMGCDGNADIDKEDKILRNISKTVIVEKCD